MPVGPEASNSWTPRSVAMASASAGRGAAAPKALPVANQLLTHSYRLLYSADGLNGSPLRPPDAANADSQGKTSPAGGCREYAHDAHAVLLTRPVI